MNRKTDLCLVKFSLNYHKSDTSNTNMKSNYHSVIKDTFNVIYLPNGGSNQDQSFQNRVQKNLVMVTFRRYKKKILKKGYNVTGFQKGNLLM